MTIMEIYKNHEKFIETKIEGMKKDEASCKKLAAYTISLELDPYVYEIQLPTLHIIHYVKSILLDLGLMIMDDLIDHLRNTLVITSYRSLLRSIGEIDDFSNVCFIHKECEFILETHVPDSFQDGIRSIWENSTTVRKWMETSSELLNVIYPHISKDEKEILLKLYSKYVKILSGESFYDLIEEKGSC